MPISRNQVVRWSLNQQKKRREQQEDSPHSPKKKRTIKIRLDADCSERMRKFLKQYYRINQKFLDEDNRLHKDLVTLYVNNKIRHSKTGKEYIYVKGYGRWYGNKNKDWYPYPSEDLIECMKEELTLLKEKWIQKKQEKQDKNKELYDIQQRIKDLNKKIDAIVYDRIRGENAEEENEEDI